MFEIRTALFLFPCSIFTSETNFSKILANIDWGKNWHHKHNSLIEYNFFGENQCFIFLQDAIKLSFKGEWPIIEFKYHWNRQRHVLVVSEIVQTSSLFGLHTKNKGHLHPYCHIISIFYEKQKSTWINKVVWEINTFSATLSFSE